MNRQRRWETEEQKLARQYAARQRRKLFDAEMGLISNYPTGPDMRPDELKRKGHQLRKDINTLFDGFPDLDTLMHINICLRRWAQWWLWKEEELDLPPEDRRDWAGEIALLDKNIELAMNGRRKAYASN
jgi:hypothetical protein